jgi:OOP family OmpA-OmpF porin
MRIRPIGLDKDTDTRPSTRPSKRLGKRLIHLRPAIAALALAVLPMGGARAQPADAAAAPVEKVTVRATAHFGFDRTTVLPADQAQLLAEVAALKDVSWQSVSAQGHADNVGTTAYNQRLSLRRAQVVKSYLVGKGLDPAMVRTDGAGAAQPVADNDSAEGRSKNRRTEVTFEGVRPVAVAKR